MRITKGVWLIPAILAVISLLYCLAACNQGLNVYDEGLSLYGAERVLRGDIPYRDFWANYSPGGFYLLAGVFRAFGPSVMVARILGAVMGAALAMAIYLTTAMAVGRRGALLAWAVGLVVGPGGGIALMVVLFSTLGVLKFLLTRRARWLVMAGGLAGVAALVRYDFCAYLLASCLLVVPVLALLWPAPGAQQPTSGAWRKTVAGMLGYLGVWALVVAPAALWLLAVVPRADLKLDFITEPFVVYPQVRWLPYPSVLGLFPSVKVLLGQAPVSSYVMGVLRTWPFWFPVLTLLAGAATSLLMVARARERRAPELVTLVPLTVLGATFMNFCKVRSDPPHLVPVTVVCLMVFAVTLSYWWPRVRRPLYRGALAGVCVLMVLGLLPRPALAKALALRDAIGQRGIMLDLPRARGIRVGPEWASYEALVRDVASRTAPGEPIFVGLTEHDKVYINDVLLYFLADRPSATKYHHYEPGIVTTREIQEEMVGELASKRVRCVVLWDGLGGTPEPNGSAVSSGVHLLDEYIRSHYVPIKRFDAYTIWWPAAAAKPAGASSGA